MKPVIPILFVIAIPLVLLTLLFTVIVPLITQHFFSSKSSESVVYPYLTSWEDAA